MNLQRQLRNACENEKLKIEEKNAFKLSHVTNNFAIRVLMFGKATKIELNSLIVSESSCCCFGDE